MIEQNIQTEFLKTTNRKNKTAKSETQLVRLEFDLSDERDGNFYKMLEAFEQKINAGRSSGKVRLCELVKLGINKITDSDLLELKNKTLSKKDKLQIWTANYNQEMNTKITAEEFAVDVLPTLSGKDLKRIQEIGL